MVAQHEIEQAIEHFEQSLLLLQLPKIHEIKSSFQFALILFSLVFSGPAIVALSGLGRIAAYHPDPVFARQWLINTIATIRETTGILEMTIARAVWGRVHLAWGDIPAAVAQFSDDLRFYQKAGARRMIAETLEGLAACAGERGQAESAIRWWSAANQLRATIGAPLWPADQTDRDQRMAQVQTQLGGAAFDTIWAAGQALTLDEAVAEALAFTTP